MIAPFPFVDCADFAKCDKTLLRYIENFVKVHLLHALDSNRDSFLTVSYHPDATGEMSAKGDCANMSSTVSTGIVSRPCVRQCFPHDQKNMSSAVQ